MASTRAGAIDDPIWSTDAHEAPRRRLSLWRTIALLMAIPGLPGLAVLVHGFDWVSLVGGIVAGTIVFVVVHRKVTGPVVLGALLLVPSFAALEAVNVLEFHTLSLGGPPPSLHWCRRDYVLGSRSFSAADMPGGTQNLRVVLQTPSGSAIYSGHGCPPRQVGVPALLFTTTAPTTGRAFGLQGGP